MLPNIMTREELNLLTTINLQSFKIFFHLHVFNSQWILYEFVPSSPQYGPSIACSFHGLFMALLPYSKLLPSEFTINPSISLLLSLHLSSVEAVHVILLMFVPARICVDICLSTSANIEPIFETSEGTLNYSGSTCSMQVDFSNDPFSL